MKRGMYVDRTNGDMWAQINWNEDDPKWTWINGWSFRYVPVDNLDFLHELPDWY